MKQLKVDLNTLSKEVSAQVVEWRRHFHRNPELSFQEEKTSQFVYDTLRGFEKLEVSRPTKTSVMARLIGKEPGKVLALRADMDALAILEENEFEFKSQNPGVMHACGHDGHTAMLLGTAKILSALQSEIKGEIRFLFQHAEEMYPGGAQEMVKAGVMDGVDEVIGAHLMSMMETGKIGITYGPAMASSAEFSLKIQGKGGHAASPHETVDSIVVAAQVVTGLQHFVSRQINPLDRLVLSVTRIHGGTANNIIPDSVELSGTVRCLDDQLHKEALRTMDQIIKGITSSYDATYEFNYETGYKAVVNDGQLTRFVEEAATEIFGEDAIDHLPPQMGGEDFSAFHQKVPGSFIFIGAGNIAEGIDQPHHHPKFTIDERALPIGVRLMTETAFKKMRHDS
ncbi:amidohydrolase [Bacillus freudenreichii]|nr:amidohydrolase [Bacillus freudenreichii]